MKILLVLLFLSTSITPSYGETPPQTLSLQEKAEVAKLLLSQENLSSLQLENFVNALKKETASDLDSKQKIEAEIITLKKKKTKTNADLKRIETLSTWLQWVHLAPEKKESLLSSAKKRAFSKENKSLGIENEKKAQQALNESEKLEKKIDQKINRTSSSREAFLLGEQLKTEKLIQELREKEKALALIQQDFSKRIDARSKWEEKLLGRLEAPDTQEAWLVNTLKEVETLLKESNQLVQSEESFLRGVLNENTSRTLVMPSESIETLSSDTPSQKKLVLQIHKSRVELQSDIKLFRLNKESFIRSMIQWKRDQRTLFLSLREKIYQKLEKVKKEQPLVAQNFTLELKTIFSNFSFWFWSRDLTTSSPFSPAKSTSQWENISLGAKLIQVCVFLGLFFFFLIKRKKILSRIQSFLKEKATSRRAKQWMNWVFEGVSDLYIFIVLLFLGKFTIHLLIQLGFEEASWVYPYYWHILLFFLFYGIIDLIRPLVSQRHLRQGTLPFQVEAMEKTFELIPKSFLFYWLFSSLIELFLKQCLEYSVLVSSIRTVLAVIAGLIFFFLMRLYRKEWRAVGVEASNAEWWRTALKRSKDRFWEPIVLLFGGGLGVYLLSYRIVKNRLGELEFAKSFQAMVSRAILERNLRKSTKRLHRDRFPKDYLKAFDYENQAPAQWHISREESEESLNAAFERWKEHQESTSVLIVGDRGIGKSHLIRQFIENHSLNAISIKLRPGDTSEKKVRETLSAHFSEDEVLSKKDLGDILSSIPPQVIVLENLENCFLRQVGGFDSLEFMINSVTRTSTHHLWLLTFTPYAWTIAKSAITGADCFTQQIYLNGMSEDQIRDLILKRHGSEKELPLDFSSLSFQQKRGVISYKEKLSLEEKQRKLYFRILWDYTGGNPRQALYFWKTSLTWENQQAKVSLFEIPEHEGLSELSDGSLMILAALIEHNGLTLRWLAKVMNESISVTRRRVEQLMPYGIVYSFGEGVSIGWHIESFWIRAVKNYLEKRQLLFRGGLK